LTSSPAPFPAREPAALASGKDYHTPIQPSGEKESAASLSAVPDSLFLNNLKEWSDADFEPYLADCEWQDTLTKLKLSRRRSLARVTPDPDCLSFPTLTSGARSLTSRPAGQTKCEKWFKDKGLIPPGYQLSAQAMALMMGFPEDWFDCLSPPITQDGSEADTSPEGQLPQHRRRSPSVESSTSTQLLGDRKNLTPSTNNPRKTRRKKGQGNGSIYYRLVTKDHGQQYQEAYYHYLENGRKKTQYIPKKLLDQVKEAEFLKLPVREILVLLGGDEKNPRKSSSTLSTHLNPRKPSPPSKKRRKQGYGAGYIEGKPIKRSGKEYPQYWYHYEIWEGGERLIKSSKYIPKGKLAQVQRLDGEKAPVREILKFLGVIK
jgi:hypothetical protein